MLMSDVVLKRLCLGGFLPLWLWSLDEWHYQITQTISRWEKSFTFIDTDPPPPIVRDFCTTVVGKYRFAVRRYMEVRVMEILGRKRSKEEREQTPFTEDEEEMYRCLFSKAACERVVQRYLRGEIPRTAWDRILEACHAEP
jgi:hypothetical protein